MSEGEQAAPPGKPADKLVLIVDDDPNIRDLLEMTLQMEGFQVLTAENGLDAQKKMGERSPDLIISDLMMPGQGGYEFLRELQGKGAGRTPIFVVSASKLDASTIGMIRQEANVLEFVAKPISMAVFLAKVHAALGTQSGRGDTGRGLNDRR